MRALIVLSLLIFSVVLCETLRSQRNVYSAYNPEENSLQFVKVERESWSKPTSITINSLVSTDIESGQLSDGTWAISPNKAVFLTNSAYPGKNGNIVIYAHNWEELFGKLQHVEIGEIITLKTEDGLDWRYQIDLKREVDPSQTVWIQPTESEVLTLYTCSGVLDSKRLVVRAMPIF